MVSMLSHHPWLTCYSCQFPACICRYILFPELHYHIHTASLSCIGCASGIVPCVYCFLFSVFHISLLLFIVLLLCTLSLLLQELVLQLFVCVCVCVYVCGVCVWCMWCVCVVCMCVCACVGVCVHACTAAASIALLCSEYHC